MPHRQPHYLRGTKRTTVPSQVITLACAPLVTPVGDGYKTNRHTLLCVHATFARIVDGKPTRVQHFFAESPEPLWDWIDSKLSPKKSTWIFGHQLSYQLSLLRFWDQLEHDRYELEQFPPDPPEGPPWPKCSTPVWRGLVVLEDPPTCLVVRRGKCNITICDVLNYYREPIGGLYKMNGLTRMSDNACAANDSLMLSQACYDNNILFETVLSLIALVHRERLGKFRITAPALAMSAFKSRFMSDKILVHCNGPVTALERESYYPGECIAFRRGIIPEAVYHLDVNSLYPHVMRDNEYPAILRGHASSLRASELADLLSRYCCIARVKLRTGIETYPVRYEGVSTRAHGEFITVLAGPELQRAVTAGHVVWCGEVAWYSGLDLFTEFVKWHTQQRQACKDAGDGAGASMFKLLGLSLFGKFSQKSSRWIDAPGVAAPEPFCSFPLIEAAGKRITNCRAVAYAVQMESIPGESTDSLPCISAFVAAYAREYMRYIILTAGVENVYYHDTDSVICNYAGYYRLIEAGLLHDSQIGKLKVAEWGKDASIVGQKHYRVGDKWTIAGVQASRGECPDGGYAEDRCERITSIMDRRPDGSVIVSRVTVHPAVASLLARFDRDGWMIPLRLPIPVPPSA